MGGEKHEGNIWAPSRRLWWRQVSVKTRRDSLWVTVHRSSHVSTSSSCGQILAFKRSWISGTLSYLGRSGWTGWMFRKMPWTVIVIQNLSLLLQPWGMLFFVIGHICSSNKSWNITFKIKTWPNLRSYWALVEADDSAASSVTRCETQRSKSATEEHN